LAPVAMQQARYVARLIGRAVPVAERPTFIYKDRGKLATVGQARAVMELGRLRFSGVLAWVLWAVVHIFFLIGFRNRFRVMSEWIWYYLTHQPGARLVYWTVQDSKQRK
jgi:NADH dehydrogenase